MAVGTHRATGAGMWRTVTVGANLLLRASMVFFAAEAIALVDDPRFEGKGIAIRNAIVIGSYSLVFPILQWLRHPWRRFPWWTDLLWLSVPWLDMAGNSLNLYDTVAWFHLVPHAHGPGAIVVVLMRAVRVPFLAAVGVVQVGHVLLEAQEYYTDVLLGTHNVTSIADPINDMLAGVAGSLAYGLAYRRLRHGRWRRPWR